MQVFKVKLDIKGLAQGAKEGEKALNGLSASADKSSNHIEKLNKSIANIQESRRRSARASIPKKPGDLLFIGFQEIIDGYQNNQRRIDKSYLEISTSPDEMHKNMVDGFATLKEKMLLKE